MRVYIAGPYSADTGDKRLDNVLTAMNAGARLIDAWHTPFIPHLSHFLNAAHGFPYDVWLEQGKAWLPLCNAVIRLPGKSKGADSEVDLAGRLGIPVYGSVEEFLKRDGGADDS